MKDISGYVLVAQLRERFVRQILFGPEGENSISTFECNGLAPFPNKKEAKEAIRDLIHRGNFEKIGVAEVRMRIAETEEEAQKEFQDAQDIALIGIYQERFRTQYELYGRIVDGRPTLSPRPMAKLQENGFEPFPNLQLAMKAAGELERRGRIGIWFATFEINHLQS